MSLVAYGSSDDSDTEDTSSAVGLAAGKPAGLFASLPAPRSSGGLEPGVAGVAAVGPRPDPPDTEPAATSEPQSIEDSDPAPRGPSNREATPGLLVNLTKPRKRTEPVKIAVPEIQRGDSDSDEDEPVRKKALQQGSAGGLSSLLPQPRNLVVKETQRPLLPHTLTKRPQESRALSSPAGTSPTAAVSASPSAIKAAAKSAALQLARQIAQEEDGSDEEVTPENYFSLPDSSQPPSAIPVPDPESSAVSVLPPPPGTEAPFQSDAPLDFGSVSQVYTRPSEAWEDQQQNPYYPQYQESSGQTAAGEPFPQEPDPGPTEVEGPGQSSLFDDEAFRRLQGKRNRGKEEVKFLDIKGDDQLSGSQQWLTKNMSEEKEQRKSFSKKKGEQPTGQQRRKHQITYLIHQAKERELELKNTWAENKLTRRQTQAKYGF
ncbi:proline-rich protein PRCC isoform X2 [Scleropages formosus]|uniref:proline-rich protein PRCC isoform X2 n=1 Tax=Scleropages formosus TaxID=113540 RepID=UPI0010FACAC8|nr:proline-rich protein PRCC isoform X2 [Scleropages formosus]